MLAIKYNEDHYYDNSFYARVGGVSLEELNFLEREMLLLLRYELYVQPQLFQKYLAEIRASSVAPVVPCPSSSECEECGKRQPLGQQTSIGCIKTLPSSNEMADMDDGTS